MTPLELQLTLETALSSIDDIPPIIYENTGQTPPNEIFIESTIRPVADERQALGTSGPRAIHSGAWWVYVIDPLVRGTSTALTEAERIRPYFTATTLDVGHGSVYMDVPQISRLGRLAKGYTVAIRIDYKYYS